MSDRLDLRDAVIKLAAAVEMLAAQVPENETGRTELAAKLANEARHIALEVSLGN